MSGLTLRWHDGLRGWRFTPIRLLAGVLPLAVVLGIMSAVVVTVSASLAVPVGRLEAGPIVSLFGTRLDKKDDPRWTQTWNRQGVPYSTAHALRSSGVFDSIGFDVARRLGTLEQPLRRPIYFGNASSTTIYLLAGKPTFGRWFTAEEDAASSESVLISEALCQSAFDTCLDAIGTELRADLGNGIRQLTVVGVLPGGFRIRSFSPDIVLPMGDVAGTIPVQATGQLLRGVTLEDAEHATEGVVRAATSSRPMGVRIIPIGEEATNQRASMWLVVIAGIVVVLLAAANASALVLSERRRRRHERAIREALGGTRLQIVVPEVTEVIATVGICCAVSLGVGLTALPTVSGLLPVGGAVPTGEAIMQVIVPSYLVVALFIAVGVFFSDNYSYGPRLVGQLRRDGGGQELGNRWFQQGLSAVVVALTCALLSIALLMNEALRRRLVEPLGFVPGDAVVGAGVFMDRGQSPDANWTHVDDVLARLSADSRVEFAGAISAVPFAGEGGAGVGVSVGGSGSDLPRAHQLTVRGQYFRALQIEPIAGSVDLNRDTVVVSEAFSKAYFAGRALDRSFETNGRVFAVVGVVPNLPMRDPHEEPRRVFYSLNPTGDAIVHFVVRSRADVEAYPIVRDAMRSASRLALDRTARIADIVSLAHRDHRLRAIVVGAYGFTAFLVSVLGLMAASARTVSDRARELQIRIMLGASRGDLFRLLLSDTTWAVGIGVVAGAAVGMVSSSYIASLAVGVSPLNGGVHGLAAALLITTSLVTVGVSTERLYRAQETLRVAQRE